VPIDAVPDRDGKADHLAKREKTSMSSLAGHRKPKNPVALSREVIDAVMGY
jgi:hypothetical protein